MGSTRPISCTRPGHPLVRARASTTGQSHRTTELTACPGSPRARSPRRGRHRSSHRTRPRCCVATRASSARVVAIKFGDREWTHAEYFDESCRFAALFLDRLPADAPRHVAVLLDNTPDYLFAFGGAALIGGAIVGLNHTRRGEHLLRDVLHTHCGLVLTEPRHEPLLAPIAAHLPPIVSSDRFAEPGDAPPALGAPLADALAPHADASDPGVDPDVDSIWALIFTSGTSEAPKAVICSQRRLLVTGKRMAMIMDLRPDDVGYVCMPLFHSSAVQVGWAPSLVTPCAVALGRRFSASRLARRRAPLRRDVHELHG